MSVLLNVALSIFASKIETAISMLKRSIIEGVRFDYLLVDSWFTCTELPEVHSLKALLVCHLIGMIKMGKIKYGTALGPRPHLNLSRFFRRQRT